MRSTTALGETLRLLRKDLGISQEEFGLVSSRTYISTVERGLKSPTLGKIEQIAKVLGVHPLTLLAISYADRPDADSARATLDFIQKEASSILSKHG